jgi:CDGSH-type Zn-finger protein
MGDNHHNGTLTEIREQMGYRMTNNVQRITVKPNGPYLIQGEVPLVSKTPVISEYGEPLTWKKGEVLSTTEQYALCRCGQSGTKPFCDGTHADVDFDGTETANTGPTLIARSPTKATGSWLRTPIDICPCRILWYARHQCMEND